MRTGRPRLAKVQRYPNGRIKRTAEAIAAAQKAAEEAEMAVVLAQPHRRGNRSQLAESALGRFVLERDLPRELYDAGEAYASLRRQWAAAWDAPLPDRLGGNGRDITKEQLDKWSDLIREWERVMLDAGGYHGRLTAEALALDRLQIDGQSLRLYPAQGAIALRALAAHQGRLGKPPR